MKAFYATLLILVLALSSIAYRVTHHPIYGGCSQQAEGYTCTLKAWKGNK